MRMEGKIEMNPMFSFLGELTIAGAASGIPMAMTERTITSDYCESIVTEGMPSGATFIDGELVYLTAEDLQDIAVIENAKASGEVLKPFAEFLKKHGL